ncbi:MAG: glycoside hydrolase family 43 protein [Melioribacter sp.]|uniref:glycoside hydrolase family 43 protein n=1 Tax=Rosettibacter primus TaxID=3111523 RepID=UPI00247D29C1|nr:glycoside hydrolase family 43 protein [Melioribacter sp.]
MKKLFLPIYILLFVNFSFAQEKLQFANPILAGFYPDPSICRVGNDYYLVNSTFAYFPGIPIFQSKDLVNWKLIGHVIDRVEQANFNGLGVSRGIFAPAISYHNGIFYVTCTLVDAGGNFVVTAKDPKGPWSNPVWIPEINGIDPSLFFDDDGKAYIIYNSVAPDNKPLYDGHRTIRIYEFDIENLKVKGEEKILINGGTDISKKPIWIEGPHIVKKDGYYFLICAEGGTAEQHSEVVFRSKNVFGPYESYKNNPILTQRHLNPKRNFPITSTGHADFVETQNGDWWAVFLGCRPYPPYEENYYNTGRETFLAPVKWIDGWPVINPDFEEVQYFYPYPLKPNKKFAIRKYGGNFTIHDDFNTKELSKDWIFLRTPLEKWFELKNGKLRIKLRPETCAGKSNPSFIGHRQQHQNCSATIKLNFLPQAEYEKAGIIIFQNENHFYFLCKSIKNGLPVVQLFKSTNTEDLELLEEKFLTKKEMNKELILQIEAKGKDYSFYYGFNKNNLTLLKENVDGTFLSTKVAGGFVGAVFGLYGSSHGNISNAYAYFDWFEYKGNDDVYSLLKLKKGE